MTIIKQYEEAIERGDIKDDQGQREIIRHMQQVANKLASSQRSWFKWMGKKQIDGLYIYGPVGVGKTYLVDLFYQDVALQHKARFHFHHFMQQVDAQLRRLQGKKDPLKFIAANLAKTKRLLCFDEFLVYDVADAMILSELLQAILEQGVVLVATSNAAPDNLYLNGVQRDRFLPAIDLIKLNCEVLALTNKYDYRLGRAPLAQAYLFPLTKATQMALNQQFAMIAKRIKEGIDISIQNRFIPTVKYGDGAVWFKFDIICNLPRSQLDYLEIADKFDTVFVSEIPLLTTNDTVRAILLINFIDVMYDRGIRLVISAEVPLESLYVKGEMINEFQRTLSRLEEMQSEDYLRRRQHRTLQSL